MFPNFYQLDLHNVKACATLANLRWNMGKNKDGTCVIYVWLYEVHACWFLKLNAYVLPFVFNDECEVVNKFWRHNSISFKHLYLCGFSFDPHTDWIDMSDLEK